MLPGRTIKTHIRLKPRNSASKTNLSAKQSSPSKFTSRYDCLSWSFLCCLILQLSWLRHRGSSKLLGIREHASGGSTAQDPLGSQTLAITATACLY